MLRTLRKRTEIVVLVELVMAAFSVVVLMSGQVFSSADPTREPHGDMDHEMMCFDCHDTYRDEVDEHEFTVAVTEICEDCHDIHLLGRSHPYDVDPDRSEIEVNVPDELPLADGMVTCGSCHNPHMSYLTTVPSYRDQEAIVTADNKYYQSYYTRMTDPVVGWDLLCDSCHHLL